MKLQGTLSLSGSMSFIDKYEPLPYKTLADRTGLELSHDLTAGIITNPTYSGDVVNGGEVGYYELVGKEYVLIDTIRPASPEVNQHFGSSASLDEKGRMIVTSRFLDTPTSRQFEVWDNTGGSWAVSATYLYTDLATDWGVPPDELQIFNYSWEMETWIALYTGLEGPTALWVIYEGQTKFIAHELWNGIALSEIPAALSSVSLVNNIVISPSLNSVYYYIGNPNANGNDGQVKWYKYEKDSKALYFMQDINGTSGSELGTSIGVSPHTDVLSVSRPGTTSMIINNYIGGGNSAYSYHSDFSLPGVDKIYSNNTDINYNSRTFRVMVGVKSNATTREMEVTVPLEGIPVTRKVWETLDFYATEFSPDSSMVADPYTTYYR